MSPQRRNVKRQPYPRDGRDLLADIALFPKQDPALTKTDLLSAIEAAFSRTLQNKQGQKQVLTSDPKKLVELTIKHLQERSDPVLTPYFYSQCDAKDIFVLDSTSHEMQKYRMKIGNFYQFLLIELMQKSKNVLKVFDGTREGDVVADVRAPLIEGGTLRIYISVKKSLDTVGGQDIRAAIHRLEDNALLDKNLNAPYMCVLFHANPIFGKKRSYENDRVVKGDAHGALFSNNAEFWGPHFMFQYITGHEADVIFELCRNEIAKYWTFNSLEYEDKCSTLFTTELKKNGIVESNGKVDPKRFYEFIRGSL